VKDWKVIFLFTFLLILSDQATKFWAREKLSEYSQSVVLIPKILNLGLVFNTGAAFGILGEQTLLLSVLSFLFCLGLFFFLVNNFFKLNKTEVISFIFIFGGAFGNLIDRFYFQKVTDFIEFLFIPNFNLADAFINIGFVLYVFVLSKKNNKTQKTKKSFQTNSINQES